MTRRGIILPSLPPLSDDFVVTVCAACRFRFCLLGCKRCDARKNGDPGETKATVAELRAAGSQEHYSYWRAEPGDDFDMPKCIEDVKELAVTMRDRKPIFPPDEEPGVFAGYLTEALGLDREQCRDAIRDVWPEAAAAIDKWMEKAS